MTLNEFELICVGAPRARLERFIEPLNQTMGEFEINTSQRQSAFIAQVAHESGCMQWVKELASGDEYEGRADLGNVHTGDGARFKGRGVIQVTGRDNYDACGRALGLDLLAHPELLEEPGNACRSAGWFWFTHNLNEIADRGDFRLITKRVNGGLRGWLERVAYYERAQQVLA